MTEGFRHLHISADRACEVFYCLLKDGMLTQGTRHASETEGRIKKEI